MIFIKDFSLLISCCNAENTEGLYKLEFKDNAPSINQVFAGDCRGIAPYQDKFLVASAAMNELLLLDADFNVIKRKPADEFMDYHGVIVDKEQAFVVETNRNAISIYRMPHMLRQGEILFPADFDAQHINDIYKVGDRLFISMFALDTCHWRQLPEESGVIVEYSISQNTMGKVLLYHLNRPHSVKVYEGALWYCNSGTYEVNKGNDVIFQAEEWTRGLAVTEDLIFIGQSFRGREMKAGVYIVNRADHSHLFVPIPSKEIYDILVL